MAMEEVSTSTRSAFGTSNDGDVDVGGGARASLQPASPRWHSNAAASNPASWMRRRTRQKTRAASMGSCSSSNVRHVDEKGSPSCAMSVDAT